jgi:Uma2 family endonuclease
MSTKTLLTSDDLWRIVSDGSRYELSKGELLPMTPVGVRHALVVNNVGRLLGEYVKKNGLGIVGPEIGFRLHRNPDTLRAPDLAFIARARYEPRGIPEKFADFPPDLVVEVLSPEDGMSEMLRKVEEYLAASVSLIWIIDPATETVTVYRSLVDVQVLTASQELSGAPAVPGFQVRIADLFLP